MTIARNAQMLREFQIAFGLDSNDTPTLAEPALRDLRVNLLLEESAELTKAYVEEDIIEVADALADIVYIAEGTAVAYGVDLDYDVTAPCGTVEWPVDENLADDLIDNVVLAVNISTHPATTEDTDRVAYALSRVVEAAYTAAAAWGFDLDAILEEVHRSNMAKLGPDGEVIRRADGKVMKPEGWQPPQIAAVLGLAA